MVEVARGHFRKAGTGGLVRAGEGAAVVRAGRRVGAGATAAREVEIVRAGHAYHSANAGRVPHGHVVYLGGTEIVPDQYRLCQPKMIH